MPTRNINLTDYFDRFIQEQIETGRFQNASEVMRAGLSLLEQKEREDALKIAYLKQEIQKGTDDYKAGRYTSVRGTTDHNALMDELEREAEAGFQDEQTEI